MKFTIEYEQEEDGRWLAEVLELLGALACGQTPEVVLTLLFQRFLLRGLTAGAVKD